MSSKIDYKVAVVGPEDVVSGFKALGVYVFPANNRREAVEAINEARKSTLGNERNSTRFAVIMITASIQKEIPADEYEKLASGALPTIVSVPDLTSKAGAGEERLRILAEKAIGSDILK